MSDPIRVEHLEEKVKIHDIKIESLEDISACQSGDIQGIEQWRTGNGARGAEVRLQGVEVAIFGLQSEHIPERMNLSENDIRALQQAADVRIGDVVTNKVREHLDARDRTVIAYIKAFGPWAIVLAGILDIIFRR